MMLADRKSDRRPGVRLLVFGATLAAAASALPLGAAACSRLEATPARAAAIVDSRTLSLSDGREILLAGLTIPKTKDETLRVRDALQLAIESDIRVLETGTDPDRYGRREAYVFVERDGASQILQEFILEQGLAVADPRRPIESCAERLARAEATARERKLGLWRVVGYAVLSTNDPAEVSRQTGRFAIVHGRILSVRESGGLIYLNFGRRWTEDFTAAVLKRNEPGFAGAGMELKRLEGRTVRVRGWIEARGGPWIEASNPRQIEILPHR